MLIRIFILLTALLIPAMMIIFGVIFIKRPPRNINVIYGYRTARSMKSREAWEFAHRYHGRLWLWAGIAMLPPSLAVMALFAGRGDDVLGLAAGAVSLTQCALMLLSIIPTERALKRNFDENGEKKHAA